MIQDDARSDRIAAPQVLPRDRDLRAITVLGKQPLVIRAVVLEERRIGAPHALQHAHPRLGLDQRAGVREPRQLVPVLDRRLAIDECARAAGGSMTEELPVLVGRQIDRKSRQRTAGIDAHDGGERRDIQARHQQPVHAANVHARTTLRLRRPQGLGPVAGIAMPATQVTVR